jgi:hypothetical protein
MHIAIRHYRMDPNLVGEVIQQIDEGFMPIIKGAPGFLAYYALDAGASGLATIGVFEERAGAEESITMAANFIRERNLTSLLPNPPEIIAGEVGAHELNLTKLGIRKVTE